MTEPNRRVRRFIHILGTQRCMYFIEPPISWIRLTVHDSTLPPPHLFPPNPMSIVTGAAPPTAHHRTRLSSGRRTPKNPEPRRELADADVTRARVRTRTTPGISMHASLTFSSALQARPLVAGTFARLDSTRRTTDDRRRRRRRRRRRDSRGDRALWTTTSTPDDGRRDGRRKRIRNAEFLPTARRRVDGRVDGRRASPGVVVVVVGVDGARPRWERRNAKEGVRRASG